MLGISVHKRARRTHGAYRTSKTRVGCEALEGRQLLSRGLGPMGWAGGFGGPPMMAELGPFGGGGRNAMFGGGRLGIHGGLRNPIFLLTSSLLATETGSSGLPSRSVLSSMAVQSAFQTLQTDFNNAVSVGSRPTHASTGQLQDDLLAIHRGKLSGTAATTAIQSDEAVILSSLGLTTDQVSQIQSDLQSLQAAIQLGTSTASTTTTVANGSSTTDPTATTPATGAAPSTTSGSSSTTSVSPTVSAIQTASQTLQTDLKNDLPSGAQASNASIGQVEDDLNAIGKGMLTGSQAVTTLQTDTAAVWTSMGLTSAQVSQIQSDQAAVEAAIQANSNAAPTTTSPTTSTTTSSTTSGSNSSSPTSIAGVEATMQSVQQYLVGLPGIGSMAMTIGGGKMSGGDPGLGVGGRSGIVGGPIMIMRHAPGISGSSGAGSGSGASGGHSAISGSVASGAPVMIPHGSLDISGGSGTIGGPVFVRSANGRQSAVNVSTSPVGFGVGGGGFGTMKGGWR